MMQHFMMPSLQRDPNEMLQYKFSGRNRQNISLGMEEQICNHKNCSTLSALWVNSAGLIFSLLFPENRVWRVMQIVSLGDNLQGMS